MDKASGKGYKTRTKQIWLRTALSKEVLCGLIPLLQRAANASCGSRDVSDSHVHPEVESREEEREIKQC